MNKGNFASCTLFLLLGFAILGSPSPSLEITDSSSFNPQLAYAQESIKKGSHHNVEILQTFPDGTQEMKFTSLSYERIPDGQNNYHDFIYSDLKNVHRVETMEASIEVDKSTCSFNFYDKGFIEDKESPLFNDSVVPYSMMVDSYNWEEIAQISNAPCETYWAEDGNTGGSLVAKRYAEGIGFIEYKYILKNGIWKTQLEATNLTPFTDRVFGFDQVINLNDDAVNFGGSKKNLDKYHNQNFERDFLESNKAKVLKFLNGYDFDFDLGFDYLDSVWVSNTGDDSSQLVFHYMRNNDVLMQNKTLIIDPTYSSSSPVVDGYIFDQVDDNDCADASVKDTITTNLFPEHYDVANPNDCVVGFVQWDISSIPDTATITAAHFKFEITTATAGSACDYTPMTVDVTTATNQAIMDDIQNGTPYSDANTICGTVGTNKDLNLGSSAVSDIQTNILSSDIFTLGLKLDSTTNPPTARIKSHHASSESAATPDPTLEITYVAVPPPDAITSLSASSIGFSSVSLTWSAPNLNGGNLTNYLINSTTPYGNPLTFAANSTDTTEIISGLVSGAQYSFRGSALTEAGYNTTGGNILNITTTYGVPPDAPALVGAATNLTSAKFTSTAGLSSGNFTVKDFGLRCELNNIGGWLNTVANSTLPGSRIYNYNGLSQNDSITCQWRDGSTVGWSSWSNNATALMVVTGTISGDTPLNDLNDFVVANGGLYFGMGIFTFGFLLIGVMASPKTVPIFTIIIMSIAAFLHVTSIFQMPYWYWGIATIMTITLVLKRKN